MLRLTERVTVWLDKPLRERLRRHSQNRLLKEGDVMRSALLWYLRVEAQADRPEFAKALRAAMGNREEPE